MIDLGLMKCFLGIEVEKSKHDIYISQHRYAKNILKRFRMDKSKPRNTLIAIGTKLSKEDIRYTVNPTLHKKLISSMMSLVAIRQNIMYGISSISRFMETPKVSHWKASKTILRYIVGTRIFGIRK